MSTFRGTMRSVNAAIRRIERDQQRRAKEAARRYKELQKEAAMENGKKDKDKKRLKNYHGNIIDKIFGQVNKKRIRLELKIHEAKAKDDHEYQDKLIAYNQKLSEWKFIQTMGNGIKNHDPELYKSALT